MAESDAEEKPNTLALLFRELARMIRPLAVIAGTPSEPDELPPFFTVMLGEMGIKLDKGIGAGTVEAIRNALDNVADAYETITGIINLDDLDFPTIAELKTMGQALGSAFGAIKSLSDLDLKAYGSDGALLDLEMLGRLLLEYLLAQYLMESHFTLFNAFAAFGIIEIGDADADSFHGRLTRVHIDLITEIVKDPSESLRAVTGWGTDDFNPYRLFVPLAYVLDHLGFPATLAIPSTLR